MNKYYEVLELQKIIDMLANEASNEKTREMIFKMQPSTELHFVKNELAKTERALLLSVKFGTPNFFSFKNMTGIVKRAKSGASLSLRELLEVCEMLRQTKTLCSWYDAIDEEKTENEDKIFYLLSALVDNKYLYEKISDSVLNEEEIADSASITLASIRRKIQNNGFKIKERLDKMIKSQDSQKFLQENIVTMRDGRYVLPVKSQYKSDVSGLVHDTSSSGSTYFIEPMEVVEANNEIRILKGQEQDEIERIIKELSGLVCDFSEQLLINYEHCAELNFYFAKANLGAKMSATCPKITDDGKVFLKKARHPLIEKKVVVPVDINVGIDFDALVITGPNTGGKTVILKTVGLLTLMAMSGLLIPASEESQISIFDNILVDIGDKQSIEQSLSTFSSHINQVIDILDKCDDKSLVLLDELGSGTDPVEGSALAVSIIEKIMKNGAKLITTTHYQELKMFALDTENVENASCEFDVKTLMPTFRLIIGSPGQSNAFAISSKLGLSNDIIARAKSLVSDGNRAFEIVMQKLEDKRCEYEKLSAEAKVYFEKAKSERETLTKEREKFENQRENILENARREASALVEKISRNGQNLMDELDEIRKAKNKEDFVQNAQNAKAKMKSQLNSLYKEAHPVTNSNGGYKLPRPLIKGDSVILFDTKKEATVLSLPDSSGNLFVQIGIMKTKININKLRLNDEKNVTINGKKTSQNIAKSKGSVTTKGVESRMTRKAELELDIRGYACDEGIMEVDNFLDSAVMSGLATVVIIHGKGTGVLKTAVREHLRRHRQVKSSRKGLYGEGEDGVTVVELK